MKITVTGKVTGIPFHIDPKAISDVRDPKIDGFPTVIVTNGKGYDVSFYCAETVKEVKAMIAKAKKAKAT